jgi:hypothetical protein
LGGITKQVSFKLKIIIMKYEIIPFQNVGNMKFGLKREFINSSLLNGIGFDSVENTNVKTGIKSTNDYFENGLILGYLNSSFLLKYVVLNDPCEATFNNHDLLSMTYKECLEFMLRFDSEIEEEEYVGFTSYKYGIAIYAPDATENPECIIECVTVG